MINLNNIVLNINLSVNCAYKLLTNIYFFLRKYIQRDKIFDL